MAGSLLSGGSNWLWEVAEGRGRKPLNEADKVAAIIVQTLLDPSDGCHSLGLPHHGEGEGGKQGDGQPDLAKPTDEASTEARDSNLPWDPRFLEKLSDVVGLYLNTPEKALVLCVDEKSQIQPDHTQPGLPLKKGRCGSITHDHKRNGTTTLVAALEVLHGKVVGQVLRVAPASGVPEVSSAVWIKSFLKT